MKQRMVIFLLAAAMVLTCSGCRERITADTKADKIEYLESEDSQAEGFVSVFLRKEELSDLQESEMEETDRQDTSEEIKPQDESTETKEKDADQNNRKEQELNSSPTKSPEAENVSEGKTDTKPTSPPQSDSQGENKDGDADHVPSRENGNGSGNSNSGSGGDSGGDKIPEETTKAAQTITVKLEANGGRVTPQNIDCTVGEPYGNLPEANRGGYTFAGWFTAAGGGSRITADTLVTMETGHTLYAHWTTRELHTVYFNPTKGWLGAKEPSRNVYTGQQYGADFPTPTCYRGYGFLGWFTKESGGTQVKNTDTFTAASDITLYAQWSYDPLEYWTGVLENCKAYPCQIQRIYVEFDENNVTTSSCNIVSMTDSVNVGRTLSDMNVSDEEILELRPDVVLKCIRNMGNAAAVQSETVARLGKRTLIVPRSAVNGSTAESVYYALYLGTLLYPDAFRSVDLSQVSRELGVSGSIYK